VHILDTLVRPVEEIPEGQGVALVEEIRITAADSAGGTAVTLAKLGAEVRSAELGREPVPGPPPMRPRPRLRRPVAPVPDVGPKAHVLALVADA
jgi:hypothetical protein